MSAVEKLLQQGLDDCPEDWSIRLELVGKVVKRGDNDHAESILSDSPAPPPDDDTLIEVLQAIPKARVSVLTEIAKSYINQHPSSAPAQYALAQLYLSLDNEALALEHYRVALAFDSSLRDPQLAQLMLDSMEKGPQTSSNTDEPEGVAEPEPEPEPEPSADEELEELAPVAIVQLEKPQKPVHSNSPKRTSDHASQAPSEKLALTDVVFDGVKKDPGSISNSIETDSNDEAGNSAEHADISLIVSEGEAVAGQDKKPDTREKLSALIVSIMAHVVIVLLLALVIVSVPREPPPLIIATSMPTTEDDQINQQVIQKRIQTKLPPQAAAAQLDITNVVAISPVALPEFDTDSISLNAAGIGDTFGMSMSLSDSNGAGMVSFFGSKSKAQKVVFVVDSSASMNQKGTKGKKNKHQLMKEELIKTLRVLPTTVEFQIIFFSGPAWFVGDDVPAPKSKKDDWHQWEGKNFWHYKDGKTEQLPVGKYIKATPSKVRKVIKQIESTPATYGTDWRAPLKMAMVMEPDIIYFMTDGAVGKHPKKDPVVKDVIAFNKKHSRAKINAICLMVPKATDMLAKLAKDSKGDFTLVKEDGKIVRGKDIGKAK